MRACGVGRAASALARSYPGGTEAFVHAMNEKARALGMTRTSYADPTGLSAHNVSTANDLATLVAAAAEYPEIRDFSTTPSHFVEVQPTGQEQSRWKEAAIRESDRYCVDAEFVDDDSTSWHAPEVPALPGPLPTMCISRSETFRRK